MLARDSPRSCVITTRTRDRQRCSRSLLGDGSQFGAKHHPTGRYSPCPRWAGSGLHHRPSEFAGGGSDPLRAGTWATTSSSAPRAADHRGSSRSAPIRAWARPSSATRGEATPRSYGVAERGRGRQGPRAHRGEAQASAKSNLALVTGHVPVYDVRACCEAMAAAAQALAPRRAGDHRRHQPADQQRRHREVRARHLVVARHRQEGRHAAGQRHGARRLAGRRGGGRRRRRQQAHGSRAGRGRRQGRAIDRPRPGGPSAPAPTSKTPASGRSRRSAKACASCGRTSTTR